ncbi:MAG: ABC transporter ATP-binding protein [Burkholderiales bacterium]
MAEAVLLARGLSKHFGGLTAVNNVSLSLRMGEIHAVIGPNGAGKSTLTDLLSGDTAPSSGEIMLRGNNIAGLSSDKISLMGVGRSYQKTNIFPAFTTFENCRLAVQSRSPRPSSWLRAARAHADHVVRTNEALATVGLQHRALIDAGTLSHGEQRQLEIAMSLATDPQVLLLDEPLAGMGIEESSQMVALLKTLRPQHAILLIEHDMDAVFDLADTLTVMVDGKVLESGAPEQIRNSRAVQEAYLGTGETHHE